jgi:hypothetical protein
MTPIDDLAFYDEPPLYKLPDLPVMVNVVFTWDIERGHQLDRAWAGRFKNVSLGGPAFGNPGGEFAPGRFLKKGITITSRGCPKKCNFCMASKREGPLRELEVKPGHIIQDNNLLACSQGHILKVFDMLFEQKQVEFKGGLDIDYLREWHVELLKKISLKELWIACDHEKDIKRLDKAADLLSDISINKKRCYAMIGLEDIKSAESRLY